jgi:Ca2+-binding EF-hand superfamily protein
MWLSSFFATKSDISEEKLEEYRMLSGFKAKEIQRLKILFVKLTGGSDSISKDYFLDLDCIAKNPLKNRIAMCFGFDEEVAKLDFQAFLCGLALFNSPGQREQKLKTAFRIQDFDNDGVINRTDLTMYLEAITTGNLDKKQIGEVADQIMRETASDAPQESITFSDFQRVVAPLDFQAKLLLPF